MLGEGHEVDTFVSKHTVADSTVCVYSGALKLKAPPAGDADVSTPVLDVPEECIPANADQYKRLANVYNGDASSLPASDRDVQHYLYFEGSTLTLFSRTPPSAELVLGLDGLTFIGSAATSMVSKLQDQMSFGEAHGAAPTMLSDKLEIKELKETNHQLQDKVHQGEIRKAKGTPPHRNLREAVSELDGAIICRLPVMPCCLPCWPEVQGLHRIRHARVPCMP